MSPYQQFIRILSDDEIKRIGKGVAGISCDARDYRLVDGASLSLVAKPAGVGDRKWLIDSESQVLEALYGQRALCRAEFDYQATELLMAHGISLFCCHPANRGNMALMIDEWRLIAVGPDDVRSQYGYFCEAAKVLDNAGAESRVMRWLNSGEAYDDYRSKTHCRYCL